MNLSIDVLLIVELVFTFLTNYAMHGVYVGACGWCVSICESSQLHRSYYHTRMSCDRSYGILTDRRRSDNLIAMPRYCKLALVYNA